jgi:DNA-binding IclR family transcriptional regulator
LHIAVAGIWQQRRNRNSLMKNVTADSPEAHRPTPSEDDRTHGSALSKGMAVLELIANEGRPLSLVDVTERLGLPKPTAHRIMRQLEDEGLLRREPLRDRYSVGPRLCTLSVNALTSAVQGGAVHAILTDLVARLGETCNIGVLDRAEMVYVDRVECDWPLRLQLAPNSRVPAHCTANGKLLLAFLDKRVRRRLIENMAFTRFTENTITDPERLERECQAIRADGYAINDQEYHVGLIGMATPIRDQDGRVVAGLAVHSPLPRMNMDTMRNTLPALRQAASRMGAALLESGEPE